MVTDTEEMTESCHRTQEDIVACRNAILNESYCKCSVWEAEDLREYSSSLVAGFCRFGEKWEPEETALFPTPRYHNPSWDKTVQWELWRPATVVRHFQTVQPEGCQERRRLEAGTQALGCILGLQQGLPSIPEWQQNPCSTAAWFLVLCSAPRGSSHLGWLVCSKLANDIPPSDPSQPPSSWQWIWQSQECLFDFAQDVLKRWSGSQYANITLLGTTINKWLGQMTKIWPLKCFQSTVMQ